MLNKQTIFTFIFLSIIVTSCSPKLIHYGTLDLSSGYKKTTELKIKKRLARNLKYKIRTTDSSNNLLAKFEKTANDKVLLTLDNSQHLKENYQVNYDVLVSYSPLLSKKTKNKYLPIKFNVEPKAKLSTEQLEVCTVVDSVVELNFKLNPIPVYDKPILKTKNSSNHLRINTESTSKKGEFKFLVSGSKYGTSEIKIFTDRENISNLNIKYQVLPNNKKPIDLKNRLINSSDNQNPPPDIDNDTSKPKVLTWKKKEGAIQYAIEIFNSNDIRIQSSLLDSEPNKHTVWLEKGQYLWRIRAQINNCNGETIWTNFSDKSNFTIE